ncbi:hypothetical protein Q31a_19220 [Aureliella helgolandensis]|uniref:Uncharacterized protein n=1 Tax=Aureliella helgolandensis TaxID=2527968 RepID=A0A518G503_9BACT|nr:hypothetical protein Q31a_19220 [Aureliella helgolandensis]
MVVNTRCEVIEFERLPRQSGSAPFTATEFVKNSETFLRILKVCVDFRYGKAFFLCMRSPPFTTAASRREEELNEWYTVTTKQDNRVARRWLPSD